MKKTQRNESKEKSPFFLHALLSDCKCLNALIGCTTGGGRKGNSGIVVKKESIIT